jgi:hypothetical protein
MNGFVDIHEKPSGFYPFLNPARQSSPLELSSSVVTLFCSLHLFHRFWDLFPSIYKSLHMHINLLERGKEHHEKQDPPHRLALPPS